MIDSLCLSLRQKHRTYRHAVYTHTSGRSHQGIQKGPNLRIHIRGAQRFESQLQYIAILARARACPGAVKNGHTNPRAVMMCKTRSLVPESCDIMSGGSNYQVKPDLSRRDVLMSSKSSCMLGWLCATCGPELDSLMVGWKEYRYQRDSYGRYAD